MIVETFIETQFSVFMVNKPGILSQVLNQLAKKKVNIVAMTMMDSVEHGVMRLVASDPDRTKELLEELNLNYSETKVLCLRMSNKAGALAEATEKLANEHINISYAYCAAGGAGGRATGILKVANAKRAMKILEGSSTAAKKKTQKRISRRAPV